MDPEEQNQNLPGWDQYGRRRQPGPEQQGRGRAFFGAVGEAIGYPLSYVTAKPWRWLTQTGGTSENMPGAAPSFSDTARSIGAGQVYDYVPSAAQQKMLSDRYGASYDPTAKSWSYAADPLMTSAINALNTYYNTLDEAGARRAIESKYYDASELAKRRAAIFGDLGEQTAGTVSDAFTAAGEDIAGLAQQGGTGVTGLTGPSQGFQSLYGTAPGVGTTLAQDTRGQVGFEVENIDDIARAALRSGTQQGRNLAEFIAKMSGEQRYALDIQLAQRNEDRRQAALSETTYMQQQDQALFDQSVGRYATLWANKGQTQKELKRHLGITKQEELVPALNQYRREHGTGAVNNLADWITRSSGIGQ